MDHVLHKTCPWGAVGGGALCIHHPFGGPKTTPFRGRQSVPPRHRPLVPPDGTVGWPETDSTRAREAPRVRVPWRRASRSEKLRAPLWTWSADVLGGVAAAADEAN